MEGPTIGIDLGTTYSCVAVYKNGEPKIIPTEKGLNTMASCVSFDDGGVRKIGDQAKDDSVINPTNTIMGVKRYIGCRFDDEELQQDIHTYLYDIIDDNGSPKIKIFVDVEEKFFAPEEISAMILSKLKEYAEAYFQQSVTKAVVTVPAHFKDSQRQATKDAGRIAGLDVLRIINEPTAAALAYGIRDKYKDDTQEKNVVVYDFGGGTFDVSIISIENGIFDVKSTNGDTHLGGNDVDLRLAEFFEEEFREKYQDDFSKNPKALRRLRMQCEKVKRLLSTDQHATIDLPLLHNGKDFFSGITRDKFEELNEDIFRSTLKFVEEALKESDLEVEDIHDVLLVGGTTRIPRVQQLVKEFFNGKGVNTSLNPDEAVAVGAAVQASILDGEENKTSGALLLLDVTSLSLGVGTAGGIMSILIPRNTQIPIKVTKTYSNEKDNQNKVKIVIYEGERSLTEGNNCLGEVILSGMKPKLRGKAKINVTFEVDTNGILYVTAEDVSDEEKCLLTVQIDKGRLSDGEITRMIGVAQKYQKEDEKRKEIIASKIGLESYCHEVKHKAGTIVNKEEDKESLMKICEETLRWIDEVKVETKEEYEKKRKEVYSIASPILKPYL